MRVDEFIKKAHLAVNSKTAYVQGAFGAPATAENKERYFSNTDYNRRHVKEISGLSADVFMFDCVCYIKSLLWGWNANPHMRNGGAIYGTNGVPDFGTETMLNYCYDVSSDFSKLVVGEVLYMKGHAGIYVGKFDGIDYALECTPSFAGGVQFTGILNTGTSTQHPNRRWEKHGKLQFVEGYEEKGVCPYCGKEF